MANKKFVWRMLAMALTFGLAASTALTIAGCGSMMQNLIYGEEDTSVNWQMEEMETAPSINKLEKLELTSKERGAIFRYAVRAHAAGNTWYKFTAEEKPGEIYYAYNQSKTVAKTTGSGCRNNN